MAGQRENIWSVLLHFFTIEKISYMQTISSCKCTENCTHLLQMHQVGKQDHGKVSAVTTTGTSVEVHRNSSPKLSCFT